MNDHDLLERLLAESEAVSALLDATNQQLRDYIDQQLRAGAA